MDSQPLSVHQLREQIEKLTNIKTRLENDIQNQRLSTNPNVPIILDGLLNARLNNDSSSFRSLALDLLDCTRANYVIDVDVSPFDEIKKLYSDSNYYSLSDRFGISKISLETKKLESLKLKKGGTLIIGARPGTGKTKLMVNMLYDDMMNNIPSCVFTLEEDVAGIYIALSQLYFREKFKKSMGFYNAARFLNSSPQEELEKKMIDSFRNWVDEKKSIVRIVESSGYTVIDIIRGIESCTESMLDAPKKIYVDYLQMIVNEPGFRGTSKESMDNTSKVLTSKIKRMNSCGIFISQLNRDSVKNKKPTSADFKESGAIEQDATTAIILERSINSDGQLLDELSIWVVKDRHGGFYGKFTCPIEPIPYWMDARSHF